MGAEMDQTRTEIWDLLYRTGPKTVEQIAEQIHLDASTIAAVVSHEWFDVHNDEVQIAKKDHNLESQS